MYGNFILSCHVSPNTLLYSAPLGINSLVCFVSHEALLEQKCITSLNMIYCTLKLPSTNLHPLTFIRQVLISTYYTNVIKVMTLPSNEIIWALQKVGFTATAMQASQPWLSCTCTKVVLTCARICSIHSLVAELLTDHFAVQWVPTPTTNCSPLSIDVHFHTSLSLTGPTSQPNSSDWMGESAQCLWWTAWCDGPQKGPWDVVKMATRTVALVLRHTHTHKHTR